MNRDRATPRRKRRENRHLWWRRSMFGFVFGVLVGFGVKMAYDFVQEERIPTDLGMAQGRNEAILDETRQIVRELRDEVREVLGSATASGKGGAKQSRRSSAPESTGVGSTTREG